MAEIFLAFPHLPMKDACELREHETYGNNMMHYSTY